MASSSAAHIQSRGVFDPRSFLKNMRDRGALYRHRGIELIKSCQSVSRTEIQGLDSYLALLNVQEECDRAITLAVDARKSTTQEADLQFEDAIKALESYTEEYPKRRFDNAPLQKAEEKDESNKKKGRSWIRRGGDAPSATDRADFYILNTLPDTSPTTVKQVLSGKFGSSVLAEILWNFGHFDDKERITLAQNPHFYRGLPTSWSGYGADFEIQPTTHYHDKVYVVINNSHRVLLQCIKRPRVLDNIWVTNGILIVRDTCGNLQGEAIVANSILTLDLYWWYCIEPPLPGSEDERTDNWKKPILRLCGSSSTPGTHKLYVLAPKAREDRSSL